MKRKLLPDALWEKIAAAFPDATFSVAGGANTSYSAEDGTVCIYEGPQQNGLKIFVK